MNATNYDVWVNGIQALVDSNGNWEADSVPLSDDGGSALVDVGVYLAGSDPTNTPPSGNQDWPQALPPIVRGSSFVYAENSAFSDPYPCSGSSHAIHGYWELSTGGRFLEQDWYGASPEEDSETTWSPGTFPIAVWQNISGHDSSSISGAIPDCNWGTHADMRSVNGQTVVALVAGGPAVAGEMQLVRLTFTASGYTGSLLDSDGPQIGVAGEVPLLASTFESPQVTITPTATNEYVGEANTEVPKGSTNAIEFLVQGTSSYSATIHAEAVQLRILDEETGADWTDTTNSVMVGQRVGLRCAVMSTNIQITNITWEIPSYAVSNYVASSNSAVLYTNLALTSQTNVFYWVDGGTNRVKCTANIGKSVVSATATFNVIRPPVDFSLTAVGTMGADTNYLPGGFSDFATIPAIHLGYRSSGYEGVVFTYTNADLTGFSGLYYQFFFVQVGSTHGRQCVSNTETRCHWTSAGLDTAFPYPSGVLDGYFLKLTSGQVSDSPYMQLFSDATNGFRSDTFDMYLMFQADGESIPVPMKKVSWTWSGTATQTNGSWILLDPQYPVNGTGTNTFEFPLWTTNIASATWKTNSSACICP